MKYLLSDLTITESVIDYIMDLIRVNFVLDSNQLPQLGVGIHKRVGSANKVTAQDTIASDVSNFISILAAQGIVVSMQSIVVDGNSFVVTLRYKGEDINFTLE